MRIFYKAQGFFKFVTSEAIPINSSLYLKCMDNILQYSWWSGSLWHYSLNLTVNHFYFFAHFLQFSKHSTREGKSNYYNNLLLTSMTSAAMIHSTQFQQYFYSRKRRKYWKKIIIKLQNTIIVLPN